jgi:hypothetical protein
MHVVSPVLLSLDLKVRQIGLEIFICMADFTKVQINLGVEDRPRLWWCPTGPFAFLPPHATGVYQQ